MPARSPPQVLGAELLGGHDLAPCDVLSCSVDLLEGRRIGQQLQGVLQRLEVLRAHDDGGGATVAGQYDAVVLSPYLFWSTLYGAKAAPGRAIVMPCLHDESYARLVVMRPVLSDPASVRFLSEPEHQLAHRLGPAADR